jgi:hypothetical protein
MARSWLFGLPPTVSLLPQPSPTSGKRSRGGALGTLLACLLLGAAILSPVCRLAAAGDQGTGAALPPIEIRGRVLSAAGEPVAGVTVELHGSKPPRRETGSDQAGRFSFPVHDGWFSLLVEAPEGRTSDLSPPVRVHGASRDVELRLQDVVVHGRLRGLSRAELAEARVHASMTKHDWYLESAVDAEGRYRITGLSAGKWNVWAASGVKRIDHALSVGSGSDEQAVDFAFPAFFAVRGRVVGAGGRPIGLENLSFHGPSESRVLGDAPSWVGVDRRGRFSTLLPSGTYRVDGTVAHPFGQHFATKPLVVAGAARTGVVVHLDARATLSGRLLGVSEPYVSVQAEQGELLQFGRVDREGRYQVTGLARGEWELAAWSCSRTVRATVRLPTDDARAVRDLPFGAGGLTLSGRLTEYDPAGRYTVQVIGEGLCVSAAAGPDGAFRLTGLTPQGYRIEVKDEDMPVLAHWPLYQGHIDLQADREVTLPLVFPP